MQNPSSKTGKSSRKMLLASLAVLGVAGIGSVFWMSSGANAVVGADSVVAESMNEAESNPNDSSSAETIPVFNAGLPPVTATQAAYSGPRVAPQIDSELRNHASRIRDVWRQGPNLGESLVAFTLNCGSYDCQALYIGDLSTGEIVATGMGYSDQVALSVDSLAGSNLMLLMWENVSGGNCAAAIYGWNGRSVTAESDIVAYAYTDAGCAQMNFAEAVRTMMP